MILSPPRSTLTHPLVPYTTPLRSPDHHRHQQNHDRLDAGDQCGRYLWMGIEPVEHAQPPVTVATTPSARNGMPAKPAGRPIVPCGKLSLILVGSCKSWPSMFTVA